MTSASKRLRDLERRYNGPIPRAERDAVLHATPRTIRSAWERIRFYRRWTLQAIEASARWRATAALGGYAHLTPLEMLARRAELACAMVRALFCISWKRALPRHATGKAESTYSRTAVSWRTERTKQLEKCCPCATKRCTEKRSQNGEAKL